MFVGLQFVKIYREIVAVMIEHFSLSGSYRAGWYNTRNHLL